VFPGEEEDVWRYDEVADAYYYHRFYHFQPDLNIANPEVREEIYKILRFWLSLGVSGFRVDAATLMIEPKGEGDLVVEDPHGVFKSMKRTVRSATADGVLLAEADDAPEKLNEYFGEGDEMDLMLNFVLNAHVTHALAAGSADPIEEGLERLPDPGDRGRFANFLRNFDELNLGRLDSEDQEATYEAFAPEEHMRIYDRGIRRRLGAMLEGDRDRIAMAHSLVFSLPGTPILVAGDEIGMGDELSLAGRNPVRTPIHWGDAPSAGFSTADPDELVRPVIEDGEFGYDRVNVDAQRADADSLLHRIVRLVRARDELPALKRGRHSVLDDGPESVFAHRYEWGDGSVDCLHNLGTGTATVELPGAEGDDRGVRVAGDAALRDGEATLDRYEYCWVRYGRP
jgi:maltose alpha-D-glucosyltransferase/alpha-amylase